MPKAHSNHRFSCPGARTVLTFLMAWFCAGAGHVVAQAAPYEGLVVYRATLSDTPKYYSSFQFKGYTDTGAWLAFDIGQTKLVEIEKGLIVKLINFDTTGMGNAFRANITSDEDIQRISIFKDYLKSTTAELPTVTKTIATLCRLLDNDLSMYRSGNLRINGRWTDKIAWQKAHAKAQAITMKVNGHDYQNPKFISLKDDTLTLAHEGGIAKIYVSIMTADEKQQTAAVLKIDPAMFAPPPAPPPMTAPSPQLAMVVKPKQVIPAEPELPRAPVLPALIEGEAQGNGISEKVAVRNARRQAVTDAVTKYLKTSEGNYELADLENKVNINIDSLAEDHEKIAMKSDVRNVVVIIKYRIERDQFVKLLAEMKLIRT